MPLLTAVSTSYKIGECTAVVLLAIALVWLLRRMVNRGRRTVPPIDMTSWRAAPQPQPHVTSVAPPGWEPAPAPAPVPAPTAQAVRPTPRNPERRSQITDAIAAAAVAAALIAGVVRIADQSASTSPWASQTGREEKAGFMYGCGHSTASAVVDCECAFAHLTSQPPYNTPAGLEALAPRVAEFVRTQGRSGLPAVYAAAFTACRRPSGAATPGAGTAAPAS